MCIHTTCEFLHQEYFEVIDKIASLIYPGDCNTNNSNIFTAYLLFWRYLFCELELILNTVTGTDL